MIAAARPRVLVAGPTRRHRPSWPFIAWAVRRAGGRPRRVAPGLDVPDADALIVSGGADVDPKRFGAAPTADTLQIDPDRDDLELELIHEAWNRRVPLLGICRGAQLINVSRGGTLALDANPVRRWSARPRKHVDVEPNTTLRAVVGATRFKVNNMHRHVVARCGRGLAVSARDEHGVVQGIEATGDRFVIGVQWHPEYLPARATHQRLFRALTHRARSRRRHR